MRNIGRLLRILDEAEKMKKTLEGSAVTITSSRRRIACMIYDLALTELILEGFPCDLVDNGRTMIVETDGKAHMLSKERFDEFAGSVENEIFKAHSMSIEKPFEMAEAMGEPRLIKATGDEESHTRRRLKTDETIMSDVPILSNQNEERPIVGTDERTVESETHKSGIDIVNADTSKRKPLDETLKNRSADLRKGLDAPEYHAKVSRFESEKGSETNQEADKKDSLSPETDKNMSDGLEELDLGNMNPNLSGNNHDEETAVKEVAGKEDIRLTRTNDREESGRQDSHDETIPNWGSVAELEEHGFEIKDIETIEALEEKESDKAGEKEYIRKTPIEASDTITTAPVAAYEDKSSGKALEPPKEEVMHDNANISYSDNVSVENKETEAEDLEENEINHLNERADIDREQMDDLSSQEFPNQMRRSDFTFCYVYSSVSKDNNLVAELEAIISPLSLEDGSEDIVVWYNDGNNSKVKASGTRKTVLIHSGDVALIASGHVIDGKFTASVELTKREEESGYSIENKSQYNGEKGHISVSDSGLVIHVFPTSFENCEDGFAEFFYVIEGEDQLRLTGFRSNEQKAVFPFNGETYNIVAKWETKSGVLFVAAMPDM